MLSISSIFLLSAKEIADRLENTKIAPIGELLSSKLIPEEYEWVGFVAPSYYSHVPTFVEACMSDIVYTKEQKIFLIVGCGGNRGRSIQDMRKHVHNSKKEVNLEYMITLPGNYILSYGAFPIWYQKLCIKLSHRKIGKIVEDIKNNRARKNLDNGIFYKEKYERALQESISKFPATGKQYNVSDQCSLCGACTKLCPVGNISMVNGKVEFGDKCNQCMGCIQWCPNHAIDYQEKAQKRKHYYHLGVKRSDLFIRS
jgi:ferredoxin